jgi:hypothetical protein
MSLSTRQKQFVAAVADNAAKRALEAMTGPLTVDSLTVDGTTALTGAVTAASTFTATGAIRGPRTVISGQGAGPIALTAAQSGALCLFDRAAGIIYTLPPPVVGLWFEFHTTVTITTNAAKVITDAATTFLGGSYVEYDVDTSRATALRTGNGTTNIAISSNGSTTGGILGSRLRFDCVSATLWIVTGVLEATGAVATAFSDT